MLFYDEFRWRHGKVPNIMLINPFDKSPRHHEMPAMPP